MNALIRLVTADINLLRILLISHSHLNILWQIDNDRTRSTCARNIEGFLNDASKIFSLSYRNRIFADVAGNSDNINLLKGIVSHQP